MTALPNACPDGPRMRSRGRVAVMLGVVIVMGLGSRVVGRGLPGYLAADPGDVLWTVAAYLAICMARPRIGIARAAVGAWLISVADELSQLYHAPWVDAIRATTLGGLFLGHGFVGRQIALYAVGACAAAAVDACVARRRRPSRHDPR